MDKHPIRVLFLCTGNSARSILAEATLRAWAGRRFEAFSAGSRPAGAVNPFALAQLADEGMPTAGLRSKSWDEFATTEAAPMDLVVTVCDSAAAEGDDESRREAFRQAHRIVKARIHALLALPAEVWDDRAALKAALDRIGFLRPEDEAPVDG